MSEPEPQEENELHGELVPFNAAPAVPARRIPTMRSRSTRTRRRRRAVHGGDGIALPARPGERHPVIPGHLRTWTGVRSTAGRHGGLLAHRGAFHAVRSPGYLLAAPAGRLSAWSSSWPGRSAGGGWPSRPAAVPGRGLRRLQGVAELHKDAQETRRSPRPGPARRGRGCSLLGRVLMLDYSPWWGWALLAAVAAAAAGPGRAPGGQADHQAGDDDPAVPDAERRHRAPRLLRGRARPPGEAGPAGHVRVADEPRRRRLAGAGRPAVRQGPGRRGEGPPGDRLRAGREPCPRCSSTATRPATAGTRCGSPTVTRWPCRSAARPLLACKPTDIWQPGAARPRRARPAGHRAADVEQHAGRRRCRGRARRSPPGCWRCTRRWTRT